MSLVTTILSLQLCLTFLPGTDYVCPLTNNDTLLRVTLHGCQSIISAIYA